MKRNKNDSHVQYGAPKAAAATGDGRLVDEDAEFGRAFVFDLELAGDASTVTVYECGAPRLKRSMTYSDVERLLDQLPTPPMRAQPI